MYCFFCATYKSDMAFCVILCISSTLLDFSTIVKFCGLLAC